MERPESFDVWEFVRWMLSVEHELFVRIEVLNNETNQKVMTLVPMVALPPDQWCFWAKRLFFDRHAAVRTEAAWRAWEQDYEESPAADYPA